MLRHEFAVLFPTLIAFVGTVYFRSVGLTLLHLNLYFILYCAPFGSFDALVGKVKLSVRRTFVPAILVWAIGVGAIVLVANIDSLREWVILQGAPLEELQDLGVTPNLFTLFMVGWLSLVNPIIEERFWRVALLARLPKAETFISCGYSGYHFIIFSYIVGPWLGGAAVVLLFLYSTLGFCVLRMENFGFATCVATHVALDMLAVLVVLMCCFSPTSWDLLKIS